MNGFHIQVRSISHDIWVIPARYDWAGKVLRSQSVSELRESIHAVADERTLSFAQAVRIVTDDGDPVERWSIRSGSAKKLKRRY